MPTGRQAQIILNIIPNQAAWNAYVVKATADMQKIAAIAAGIGGGVGPGPPGRGPTAVGGAGGGAFMLGWQRAGGFPAALGTILKFGLAYKLGIDIPLKIINTSLDAVKIALVEGGAAWMDYQEQMASAARTMEQPGFTRPFLTEVMGRDALNFLKDYRVTMEQVAQAQYELGSAGFTAAQTLQTYTVPLKLAIGLHGDVTQTTRILTQMLKIHGEQLQHLGGEYEQMMYIAGIVAKSWQVEQFELSDLAASYKYVASSATALRLPMEQLIPLLGFLSTYGLRGSLAGTALNQMIVQLSRNVNLTAGQIDSLTKKVRGMEHVITLKPGAHTIFDVMLQMAVALNKAGATSEERIKANSAAFDMLNIRGGRPLVLIMARLTEYLGKVGDAAKMTTADCEAFVESLVKLAQATVPAQLDIASNKLQVMGIRFFQAAIGADTAVSALEKLNRKLDTFIEKAEDAGDVAYRMFRQVVGFVEGAWEEIRQPTRWRLPILPGLLGGAIGAKEAGEESLWEVTERPMRREIADQAAELLKSGMGTNQVRGRIESTILELSLERAAKGLTTPRIDIDKIIKKAQEEETARRMGMPQVPGPPEYEGRPTGAGARAKTAQEKADAAARKSMQFLEDLAAYRTVPSGEKIAGLQRILARGGLSFGGKARVLEEITRTQQEQVEGDYKKAGQAIELGAVQYERSMQGYSSSLEGYERRLNLVNAEQSLYGDTLELTRSKIALFTDQQNTATAAMEREEARLGNLQKQYDELLRIVTGFEAKPGTPEQLEYTSRLEKIGQLIEASQKRLLGYQQTIQDGTHGIAEALKSDADRIRDFIDAVMLSAEERAGVVKDLQQLGLEAQKTQVGWMRGSPGEKAVAEIGIAQQELAFQMAERRKELEEKGFGRGSYLLGIGDPQTYLDNYERIMNADAIMRPWLEARDRIEGEWTDMFTNVFTRMAAGEKDALWAGLGSIVQSLQGQMIAQWTKRHLGGLFDVLAQQEVGPTAGPAGLAAKGESEAELKAQVLSRSLTILDEKTTTAATGLSGLNTEATAITGTFSALNAVLAQTIATVGGQPTEGAGILGFGANVPLRLPGVATAAAMSKAVEKGVQKGIEQAGKQPVTVPAPTTKATRPSATTMAGFMGNYAAGSMFAGMVGGAMGYEPGSAGVAGGLGYAAGMALGFGPWGAAALGLASIFGFGKKKKRPQQEVSPQRDIYGMPAFEWESYLYNLYKNEKALSAYALGSVYGTRLSEAGGQVTVNNGPSVGQITININGGDIAEVRRVLDSTLGRLFGSVARANAGIRASSS